MLPVVHGDGLGDLVVVGLYGHEGEVVEEDIGGVEQGGQDQVGLVAVALVEEEGAELGAHHQQPHHEQLVVVVLGLGRVQDQDDDQPVDQDGRQVAGAAEGRHHRHGHQQQEGQHEEELVQPLHQVGQADVLAEGLVLGHQLVLDRVVAAAPLEQEHVEAQRNEQHDDYGRLRDRVVRVPQLQLRLHLNTLYNKL